MIKEYENGSFEVFGGQRPYALALNHKHLPEMKYVLDLKKAPFFTSIALVGSNLGSFLSPIIANYLGTQSSTVIFNAGLINIVTGVVTLIVIIATKERRHHVHQKLVK